MCCDNCSLECNWGLPDCKVLTYPSASVRPSPSESQKMFEVSDEQTQCSELNRFHISLLMPLLKRDASGNLKIFNHPSLLLGVSDIQISQFLRYCSLLFTIKHICNFVEIWDLSHALKIHTIMQKVFGDMDGTNGINTMEEFSSDEEDELLPEDWNDLGLDDELAEMAMNELTLAEIDDSQCVSIYNMPKDIPISVLNILMNLSFDAVL